MTFSFIFFNWENHLYHHFTKDETGKQKETYTLCESKFRVSFSEVLFAQLKPEKLEITIMKSYSFQLNIF